MEPLEIEASPASAAIAGDKDKSTKSIFFRCCRLDVWLFPFSLLVCPGLVVGTYYGIRMPADSPWWTWAKPNNIGTYEHIARIMADRLNITLPQINNHLRLLRTDTQEHAEEYAVTGGKMILRIEHDTSSGEHQGTRRSAVLGENIPSTRTLLHHMSSPEIVSSGSSFYTGFLLNRVTGHDLEVYGAYAERYLTIDQARRVAGDIAVALNTLHSKINGYTVMHCAVDELHVFVRGVGEDDYVETATLINYGSALVGKIGAGEKIARKMFLQSAVSHPVNYCHGTNWDDYETGPEKFNVLVDWRQLGRLIYNVVEDGYSDDAPDLFKGRNSKCNYYCAAEKNLRETKRLKGPLLDLTRKLFLEHEKIGDEVAEILNHDAFKGLVPHPTEQEKEIQAIDPTATFQETFEGG